MADNLDPAQIEQLNRAFEDLSKTTEGLGGTFNKTDTQIHNAGVSVQKAGQHFDQLTKKLDYLNKLYASLTKKIVDNDKQEKRKKDQSDQQTKASTELKKQTDETSKSVKELNKTIDSVMLKALEDAGQQLKTFNNAFQKLNQDIQLNQDSLKNFTSNISSKLGTAAGDAIKEQLEEAAKIADPKERYNELSKILGQFQARVNSNGEIIELNTKRQKELEQISKQYALLLAEQNVQLEIDNQTIERKVKLTKYLNESIFTASGRTLMFQKALTSALEQLLKLASLDSLIKGFEKLVSTAWKFGTSLAKGETSFSTLNPIIDLTVSALSSLLKAIPFFGEALSAATKAAGEAAKFVIEQLDGALKKFQEFSKFGALTADGMSGLQAQFQNAGMSLDGLTKMLKSNADYLATWKGTVGAGAKQLAVMVGQVTKTNGKFSELGDGLRRMGMTADDIGESMAYYMQLQIRTGKARGRTDEDLIKSAVEYTKQLDVLQKLTGKSKEALQEEQNAMLSDARFRAALDQQEAEGNRKGAEAMKAFVNTIYDPDLKKSFQDLLAGNLGSKRAQELARDLGDEGIALIQRVREGLSPEEAKKALIPLLAEFKERTRDFAAISEADQSTLGNYAKFSEELERQLGKNIDAAKTTQKGQIEGQDALTNTTVKAQKQMEALSRRMQELAFKWLPDASVAVDKFTESLNDVIDYIDEKLGTKRVVQSPAMAAANQAVRQQEEVLGTIAEQVKEEEKKLQVLKDQKATSDKIAEQQKVITALKAKEAEENKKMQQAAAERREQYFKEREERKKWEKAANLAKSKGEALPAAPPGYEIKNDKLVYTGSASTPGATGAGAAAPAPGGGAGLPTDERIKGLKLRQGNPERSHKSGAYIDPKTLDLAEKIQSEIKDFSFFSSINDQYHMDNHPNSSHTKGKALDIILDPYPSYERAAEIKKMLYGMGAKKVLDEYYDDANQYTTGGHFHVEVARSGGKFSGREQGFPVLLHGKDESVWKEDQIRSTLAEVKKTSIEQYKNDLMSDLGLGKSSGTTARFDSPVFTAMLDVLTEIKNISEKSSRTLDQQLTYAKA